MGEAGWGGGGWHPSLKLTGIPTFILTVSLTHRVGWYPHKKLGRVTLTLVLGVTSEILLFADVFSCFKKRYSSVLLSLTARRTAHYYDLFESSFIAFSFISRDSETWASGKWSVYFVIL